MDDNDKTDDLSPSFENKIRKAMIEAGWDKLSKEELLERVSESLDILVQKGKVERLVGEDGNWYYRTVKEGDR